MDASQLAAEDYASADRAQQLLADRFNGAPSLYRQMKSWEDLVINVEKGFDTTWIWEYHSDLACRDWLHDALPILTPAMQMLCQRRIEELDARYRAATGPAKELNTPVTRRSARDRWWHDRYPLLIDHDEDTPLPPSWSPAPTRIA
ncbi:hypothetical protein [Streptomyces sp. NPDC001816]|uniref:hypothetical protein n=1 Tax=Streptomyces sp. NPDC001816 TaxID=3364612 RepID=UPI0036C4D318